MITPEEIGEIEAFSPLAPDDRERLARAAADISLIPGEFAAQEGDERAIFAIPEGRIEAVKMTDGIERVVGERRPGEVFGEVPIVLGTAFPVRFRAAEPTRVLRIDPAAYHSLAAVAPDIAREIGRLAAHRMGGKRGLQGLAADPPPPRAIVVGDRWDPACAELRSFLDRNQITYRWLTGESADGLWDGPLPERDDWPAIRAVQAALFSTHARSVTILCRGDGLEKSMSRYLIDQLAARSNIEVTPGVEVDAVHGDGSLGRIGLRDVASGEVNSVESSGLFVFIGADAETEWLPPEISLDSRGYVPAPRCAPPPPGASTATPSYWRTSVPRIFACGDVRSGPVKRVAAVGEGSMSIAFVHQYLREAEAAAAEGAR